MSVHSFSMSNTEESGFNTPNDSDSYSVIEGDDGEATASASRAPSIADPLSIWPERMSVIQFHPRRSLQRIPLRLGLIFVDHARS